MSVAGQSGTVKVEVVEARKLKTAADSRIVTGTSDVYVKVVVKGSNKKMEDETAKVKKSVSETAHWGEAFTFAGLMINSNSRLKIKVLSLNDLMGKAEVSGKRLLNEKSINEWITIERGEVKVIIEFIQAVSVTGASGTKAFNPSFSTSLGKSDRTEKYQKELKEKERKEKKRQQEKEKELASRKLGGNFDYYGSSSSSPKSDRKDKDKDKDKDSKKKEEKKSDKKDDKKPKDQVKKEATPSTSTTTTTSEPTKKATPTNIGAASGSTTAASEQRKPQYIQKPPVIEIWRIENGQLVSWPLEKYGRFHTGDSYIILYSEYILNTQTGLETEVHSIHLWIGAESTPDEIKSASEKYKEVESEIGGLPSISREVQYNESPRFVGYFKELIYLMGGIDSGWREPEKDKPVMSRLLHIKGKKKVRVTAVPLSHKSLNKGDCFILDEFHRITQWNGSGCNTTERRRAHEILNGFINERTGKCESKNIDEGEESQDFWKALGGKGPISEDSTGGSDTEAEKQEKKHVLWKLSDASGSLKFTQVAEGSKVSRSMLDEEDVFLLDIGAEIFVWVGKKTTEQEKSEAMKTAETYLSQNNRPWKIPITRLISGGESLYFIDAFNF